MGAVAMIDRIVAFITALIIWSLLLAGLGGSVIGAAIFYYRVTHT